jgi:hypothetical protein
MIDTFIAAFGAWNDYVEIETADLTSRIRELQVIKSLNNSSFRPASTTHGAYFHVASIVDDLEALNLQHFFLQSPSCVKIGAVPDVLWCTEFLWSLFVLDIVSNLRVKSSIGPEYNVTSGE